MVKYYFQQRINSQRIETKRNSNIQIKPNIYQVEFFPFLLYIINYNKDKKDIPFFFFSNKACIFSFMLDHICMLHDLVILLTYNLHNHQTHINHA